jgi:outer membrane protein assembly factor BamB
MNQPRIRDGHGPAVPSGRLGGMRPSRLIVPALALAVSGCTSSPGPGTASSPGSATAPAATQSPSSPGAWDWPNYHRDPAHTGFAGAAPPAGRLSIAWTRRLDGAVYGQPLVVGGLVIAATQGDSIYGLDRATGRVRWRAHAGTPVPLVSLPCGNIDPLGITGTPVYDPATKLVYAVAETTGYHHVLVGVSVASGRIAVRRDIPTPDGQPRFDQQRSALTLAGGRVYVGFGGLFGDCGPYRGSVVGVPATGRGPLVSYVVPTAREGGIWGAGGMPMARGTIYAAVGNGAATGGAFDGSDSVTALSPGLHRTGIFAPAVWAADNANDLDLGSLSPVLVPSGLVLSVGKRGVGYLLDGARLGGVGGQLAQGPVCPAFGGAAMRGTVAYVPCASGGMAAVNTAGRRIRVLWRGPAPAAGSPVIGGGAVWVADWDAGDLYQLDPAPGHVRQRIALGSPLPHFASPALSGPFALIGTMSGVTAVAGA